MARLLIPEDFTSQKKLLAAINDEHLKQANDSVLTAYLTENGINLETDLDIANNAQTHDDSRMVLVRNSTNYTQLRNLQFDPAISNLKSSVQFLKSLNKKNPKQLGDWFITVIGNGKISYPTNFDDLAKVASDFFDKHLGFTGNTSPLHAFVTKNNIDVKKDRAAIDSAIAHNNNSTQTAKDAENATEMRNLIWAPVINNIRGIGNYLMKLYPDNPRALGAFGFNIDETATKPKEVVTKIKLGDKTTLKGVVIGGTLKNIGTVEVHVYKGTTTNGNPNIIHPKESFGIAKGFNTITITNPSNTTEAKISALRST